MSVMALPDGEPGDSRWHRGIRASPSVTAGDTAAPAAAKRRLPTRPAGRG